MPVEGWKFDGIFGWGSSSLLGFNVGRSFGSLRVEVLGADDVGVLVLGEADRGGVGFGGEGDLGEEVTVDLGGEVGDFLGRPLPLEGGLVGFCCFVRLEG